MALAILLTNPVDQNAIQYSGEILNYWYGGFWNLLEFGMQMMLILILGHVLANTGPVKRIINYLLRFCTNNVSAAFFITFFTIIAAMINWGLGLIFGAIMARKVAENATVNKTSVNFPLLAACGYSGMMVWHGGFSGSAPLTVAESGHFLEAQTGIIPVTQTLFSAMNITVFIALLVILPTLMMWIAKRSPGEIPNVPPSDSNKNESSYRLNYFAVFFAVLILGVWLLQGIRQAAEPGTSALDIISLNYINYLFLGLCLLFTGSFQLLSQKTGEAIASGTGIFLQFPFYAGIMGIMAESGLLAMLANFFADIATPATFPLLTFVSGGIVNVFVPSGGGQWAVQGPLIIEASEALGVSFPKNVMALAYGDQITNMIQPFWALPLLGITGLKPGAILPYTLCLMLTGIVIYVSALMIF